MSDSDAVQDLDPRLFERIELAFPELVGGFEVLERELEFDGRRIADLLAHSQGRVLLVSLVDGAADAAALRALDGLAFAQTQPAILAGALPSGTEATSGVRVVLVSVNGFSTRQLERLGTLREQGLWLLRKRELRTKRGTHTRLETIDVGDGRGSSPKPVDLPAWAVSEPHRSFLARVAPDRLDLALCLLDRLRSIDPGCEWDLRAGELVCRVRELVLCSVAWVDGHLELSADEDAPARPVRDLAAIDREVDGILADYLEGLEPMDAPGASPQASEPSVPALAPVPALVRASRVQPRVPASEEFDELPDLEDEMEEELDQIELRPVQPGPLLTREEIEAFQE